MTADNDPESSLGDRRWWGYLRDLDKVFKFDQNSVKFVTLGEQSYFLVDSNGEPFWGSGLPTGLYDKLWGRQRKLPSVDLVTLGEDDAYFVQFVDGEQKWCGLPSAIDKYLEKGSGRVQTLALGPDESWFCKWENGSTAWEGLPTGLYNKINGRQKSLPGVDEVTLGPAGDWFVKFEDGDWQCQGHTEQCDKAINKIKKRGGDVVHLSFGGSKEDPTWLITYDE